jgi:hypothetical protein
MELQLELKALNGSTSITAAGVTHPGRYTAQKARLRLPHEKRFLKAKKAIELDDQAQSKGPGCWGRIRI